MFVFRAVISGSHRTLSRLQKQIHDECFLSGASNSVSQLEGFFSCKLYLSLIVDDPKVFRRIIQDSGAKEISIYERAY